MTIKVRVGVPIPNGRLLEAARERGYPVLRNTPEETELAAGVAREVSGAVNATMQPVMGAEDFAFMLGAAPGCYVFLGSRHEGEATPRQLHNPRYDFNDEVLPVGIRYWATLAERYLGEAAPKGAAAGASFVRTDDCE